MTLRTDNSSRREAGFTLLELLLAASIMVAVMTGVLTAIEMSANITRVQVDVADVQQSMRVSQREMHRLVRMAGRGGLPRAVAIPHQESLQNVAQGTTIGPETVVEGTDMIILRGAFNTPIYRVDAADATTFQISGATATLVIDSVTQSAFDQPFDALRALIDNDTGTVPPEPILLVGRQGDSVFATAELGSVSWSDFRIVTIWNQ